MQGSLHYIGLLILMLDMHMYKGMRILLFLVLLLFISFSLFSSAFKHSLNKLFLLSSKLIMKQKYSSTGSETWKGTILFLTYVKQGFLLLIYFKGIEKLCLIWCLCVWQWTIKDVFFFLNLIQNKAQTSWEFLFI